MSTNVDTNLELFLSIVEDIDEPCEHSEHESRPKSHAGSGEWYLEYKPCTTCGDVQPRKLVCDKFLRTIKARGRGRCRSCNTVDSIKNIYASITWKG